MRKKLILILLFAPVMTGWVIAAPVGTAISYQGYLSDKGKPATDLYNFTFKLYDAPTSGALVGSPNMVILTAVPVTNGLFSVGLDFGSSAFLGDRRWLEIWVAPNGSSSYTMLSPRAELRPGAYSLYALKADTATTVGSVPWSVLTGVPAGFADATDNDTTYSAGAGLQLGGTTFSIADGGVTSSKLANGQVVRSLNGLTEAVTLSAGAGLTLIPNGNTLTISASGGSAGWSLTGNNGTTAGVNFLGTTDNQPLELKTFNVRALRLEYVSGGGGSSINTIGGLGINRVFNGAFGATIAGGGLATGSLFDSPNEVGADFGTIGGGNLNIVRGAYGTIPGGYGNEANGEGSFAAGRIARAAHDGSFVWGDGTGQALSRGDNRFDVRATGGASFFTGNNYLRVAGPFLQVSGAGGEEAYLGGDGAGDDVQVGSFNPAVVNVALYNAGNNSFMNLVARDTSVRTLTITGGADLAEPFPMSESAIPKGAVVIIDAEHPGRLKLSTEPYDTRVAGVVSGAGGVQPGIQMSQKGSLEGTENVALTGRVYVLADASREAIHPGDLLTTSATPGHAMKVSDHARAQGAILGKAMSALGEGKGMVLVLVTLQ